MPIIQASASNPISTLVAGVYTVIQPPPVVLAGAPTNILGLVGVASWGPVGQAIAFGDPNGAAAAFGPVTIRAHDIAAAVSVAALQGVNAFRAVRVSDGTDVAASVTLSGSVLTGSPAFWTAVAAAVNLGSGVNRGASALVRFNATTGVFSALYTGVVGNSVVATVSQGSKVGTFRLTVSAGGAYPEIYDNLPAAAGALPTAASYTLAGGTDGASAVTTIEMLGVDVAPRTGMYALRGQGCSTFTLIDDTDPTTWSAQIPFAQSEGCEGYVSGPSGDTISNAATVKATAGVDDYSMHVMFGDWLYWSDVANNVIRLVSPAVVAAATRAATVINQSILNTPIFGIVGSQKSGIAGSGNSASYAAADIEALVIAGIDVIGNPSPGGQYWSALVGHNSSSNASVQSDTYTAMTNFLAKTINGGMGVYVGKNNGLQKLMQVRSTLMTLLAGVQQSGLIGDNPAVPAYSVVCNASNNPQAQRGLGYTVANVMVTYQGITEKFFVNLEGGATVSVG